MSNAKKLLLLLCTVLVAAAILHRLTDWLPYAYLSLAVCPIMLYLSFGFCNHCNEYGADCACAHSKARRKA